MKTTLILSFIFVVCVLSAPVAIVQANEQEAVPEFSVSINAPAQKSNSGEKYEKKYSTDESGTSTVLVVSNAMARLLKDDDGDEYYPKLTFKFDLDVNKTTNYYIVFYLNLYGDWFVIDETAVYTLEEGYSSEEGVWDLDLYFIAGYEPKKIKTKVEIYYEDEGLAAAYGPDDDPDLGDVPIESGDYDEKEDPFANYTPTPTPTPVPTIDEIKLNDSKLKGNRLILRKGESIKISAEALSGGEAISNAEIKAEVDYGEVTVSPSVATTDESGLAEFTITAKKKGNAKIFFTSGDAKKVLRVKVK